MFRLACFVAKHIPAKRLLTTRLLSFHRTAYARVVTTLTQMGGAPLGTPWCVNTARRLTRTAISGAAIKEIAAWQKATSTRAETLYNAAIAGSS